MLAAGPHELIITDFNLPGSRSSETLAFLMGFSCAPGGGPDLVDLIAGCR